MIKSSAFRAIVALATCSAATAFVKPAHLCNSFSTSTPQAPSHQTDGFNKRPAPASRGEASAVGPLEFGRRLRHIARIFKRPSRGSGTCIPTDKKAQPKNRAAHLKKMQKRYEWDTTGIPVGTPYLKGYPLHDLPTVPWLAKAVDAGLDIIIGLFRGNFGAPAIVEALTSPANMKTFLIRLGDVVIKTGERAKNIKDFKELHAFPLKNPDSQFDWDDDDTFCRLRLQGANSVVLEKCSAATRAKLTVLDTDSSYKELKTKVDSLMSAGKLFVVDQEILANMTALPYDGWDRYLTPSVALFEVVEDDLMPMKPIGIQLGQGDVIKGEDPLPIFVPEDGWNWQIAKACFEASEFTSHELVSHLGNTHVVMEGAMVSMYRQLPKEHPMFDLLYPHIEGTAFINYYAQDLLIIKDGIVDQLSAANISDAWSLTLNQTLVRIASDFSPEADFKARGVTTEDFPGRYMYRDVGTQYWEATHTWVKEYVDIYYATDADMVADYELQAFITEMKDTAQMKWLDEFENSSDKKALVVKVFASLIYTASTLHAAVNFPQKPTMSFIPSCPGAVYAEPPTDKTERTEKDYLRYLTPIEIAVYHVAALTLLGSIHHTELGEYSHNNFADKRVNVPLVKFKGAIDNIEAELKETNAYLAAAWMERGKETRDANNFKYKELLPANIPQSINI